MKEEKNWWPFIICLLVAVAFVIVMLEQGRPVPPNFGDSKEEFYGGWGGRDYTNGSNNEHLQDAHRQMQADTEWKYRNK